MNSDQIDILIELSDEQLEIVSGGNKKAPPPPIHDIHFTKVVDKASLN